MEFMPVNHLERSIPSQPWLSVLMPVYNGEPYIARALDSILVQEDDNIECIVVDGDSIDGTMSVLADYKDRFPLRILKRERSSNWVMKTNQALAAARGRYICFLHHDDVWFKNRLPTIRHLTEQFPVATLLVHPSYFLDARGNKLGIWRCPLPSAPTVIGSHLMIERLLIQNFVSIVGAVFKREAAVGVDGLDESLWYTADWDFWLKLAACGESIYYPRPLSGFRIHPTSQTVTRSSHSDNFREQLEAVSAKHFSQWRAPEDAKQRLRKLASFSMEVNIALASAAHGNKLNLRRLLLDFLRLGPVGWHRYLRDSRIWERVSARMKVKVRPSVKFSDSRS